MPCASQTWNDDHTRTLVGLATSRRAQQLADSTLVDYRATARGFVTFLAQLGEGFRLPPKVVKADELALEVYWRAPNFSKQWIVGRRDTLVLPTDIQYHRDHLGIVQNNFPDIIRLGDGDEVRDVPHPLSAAGLAAYDFAVSDSFRLEIPGRSLQVIEVKIRPRDDRQPAAVGSLYLSRDDAQVVRMAFSFTRSALKDEQLEDVSIILENSLIVERYWLPRRQEIEIRRTGSWMDFPVKGIIRGRWEIRDYTVNAGGTVAQSPGPEIVFAPPQRRSQHRWPDASILDQLPGDVTLATNDDVRTVQEEARRLVRAQSLARAQRTLPSARGFSDLAQVNRVEGLAVGGGLRRRLGNGVDLQLRGRYGTEDREAKGQVSLGFEHASGWSARVLATRDFRDVSDEPEASRARNSLAAQEFGADLTQPFAATGGGLHVNVAPPQSPWRWTLETARERHDALAVHATPARRRFSPTLAVDSGRAWRLSLRLDRSPSPWRGSGGGVLRLRNELRFTRFDFDGDRSSSVVSRLFSSAELAAPVGRARVVSRAFGGVVGATGDVPVQEQLYAGGPVTAPGYGFHEFRATTMLGGRVEWQHPAPFVPLPLGRWGRIPGSVTLSPFAGALWTNGAGREGAVHPFVGIGVLSLLDLVRIDVAKGLKDGRWRFAVDLSRDFWPIL